jgi:SAM-dependent methyltransferase
MMEDTVRCTVCGGTDVLPTVDIAKVPIYCNVLWPTRTQALDAASGHIALGFCEECGHFLNMSFDPTLTDYTANYENSLHFSPRFNEYAERLARRLIETYYLRGKDVIEIGCGKGDFLRLLCREGHNRGVGFDRSYEPDRESGQALEHVRFIQDFYGGAHAELPADFVVCRHVLEHIDQPTDFLRRLRGWLSGQTDPVLYFEVPNALFTIGGMGIWDLIYEHPSYFSRQSLAHAFEKSGFDVLEVGESFGGQYLYIEAMPTPLGQDVGSHPHGNGIEALKADAAAFASRYRAKVDDWSRHLESSRQTRTVIWGGGSKGVTFLNVLRDSMIDYVVDLNPHKHGKFVPGTGQMVVAPEQLIEYAPDRVLIMNELYREEIARSLQEMAIDTSISVV